MERRYCPRCSADVRDVGGFCLLGHPLGPPETPLSALRTEVDEAFDSIARRVDESFATLGEGGSPTPDDTVQLPAAFLALAAENAEDADFADMEERVRKGSSVWKELEAEPVSVARDPISAFAPAPRMDWGPEPKLKRRGPAKGPRPQTA